MQYLLISEGSSDRALIPIVNWILRQHPSVDEIIPLWVNPAQLPRNVKGLRDKITASLSQFSCDALFIHRDADNQKATTRFQEIAEIISAVEEEAKKEKREAPPPYICVVPVRMMEAWLLLDESAIRRAADNPNGNIPLALPDKKRVEDLPNPKAILNELLSQASGLSPHRRRNFHSSAAVMRVPDFVEDFSLLRGLTAFDTLEAEIAALVAKIYNNQ